MLWFPLKFRGFLKGQTRLFPLGENPVKTQTSVTLVRGKVMSYTASVRVGWFSGHSIKYVIATIRLMSLDPRRRTFASSRSVSLSAELQ